MSSFIIKPIFWNTNSYTQPSGVRASSGYPKENGFGHEEWNNSSKMQFLDPDDGVRYHAFHTEGVGNSDLEDGETFVFMVASHNGIQQLVGVAGNATCLIDDDARRGELAKNLSVRKFWEQAWEVKSVQVCFGFDKGAFRKAWNIDVKWIPNWLCPSDLYLWLDEPVTLDPFLITGKKRLVTMYNSFCPVYADQASTILNHIPEGKRNATWKRLSSLVEKSGALERDIKELVKRKDIPKTTKESLIKSRMGQGRFRQELEMRWEGRCGVTGCGVREINRASHIKPWKSSSDRERLDSNNGILLAAHIDALFDRGLISFSSRGEMLISDRLPLSEQNRFGLPMTLRETLHDEEKYYLKHHRETNGF